MKKEGFVIEQIVQIVAALNHMELGMPVWVGQVLAIAIGVTPAERRLRTDPPRTIPLGISAQFYLPDGPPALRNWYELPSSPVQLASPRLTTDRQIGFAGVDLETLQVASLPAPGDFIVRANAGFTAELLIGGACFV